MIFQFMHMKKNIYILILFVSLHESQVHFLYLHPLPGGLPPIQDMQPMFALSRVRKLFQKDNNVYFFCEWITTFTLICRKVIHSHRNYYLLGEATLYPRQRKEKSLHMHKQHVRTHTNGKKTYQQKIIYIYIYIRNSISL
jgi:hypothetical protein